MGVKGILTGVSMWAFGAFGMYQRAVRGLTAGQLALLLLCAFCLGYLASDLDRPGAAAGHSSSAARGPDGGTLGSPRPRQHGQYPPATLGTQTQTWPRRQESQPVSVRSPAAPRPAALRPATTAQTAANSTGGGGRSFRVNVVIVLCGDRFGEVSTLIKSIVHFAKCVARDIVLLRASMLACVTCVLTRELSGSLVLYSAVRFPCTIFYEGVRSALYTPTTPHPDRIVPSVSSSPQRRQLLISRYHSQAIQDRVPRICRRCGVAQGGGLFPHLGWRRAAVGHVHCTTVVVPPGGYRHLEGAVPCLRLAAAVRPGSPARRQ